MIEMRSATNRCIQRSTSPRGAARSIRSGRSIWSPAMTHFSSVSCPSPPFGLAELPQLRRAGRLC